MARGSRAEEEDEEAGEATPLLETSQPVHASSPASPAPLSSSSDTAADTARSASTAESQGSSPKAKQAEGAAAKAPVTLLSASSLPSKELAICRICLEEDAGGNLDTPCSCAGTQRHAHQACIQKWIDEKGHLRCEICGQQYKGNYTAPPPRPPPATPPVVPVFIVDPNNPTRIAIRRGNDVQVLDDPLEAEYQRHPGMNFVFTSCVFILFLVVLHHTMGVNDSPDDTDYTPSPSPITPDQADPTMADGVTFFLFWIFTKVLLIGIPLWTILRVAQRQAENQRMEELMRGAVPDAGNRRIVFRLQTVRGQEPGRPIGNDVV